MSLHFDFPHFDADKYKTSILRDLRSDHAGETGAVYIYKGILSTTKDNDLKKFSLHHLETEKKHLEFFEKWLPNKYKSILLPLWRVSGYVLGKIPALLGPRWVYFTIEAVESFVIKHYQEQIDKLNDDQTHEYLLKVILNKFKNDEIIHEIEANNHIHYSPTIFEKILQSTIKFASSISVKIARII